MGEATTAKGRRRQARNAERARADVLAQIKFEAGALAEHQENALERRLRRDAWIGTAKQWGISLREIAEAAGISHTAVAKIGVTDRRRDS